jgi:hypothetical protein
MSCDDCEEFQKTGDVYYFRWGVANIGIICCDKHFREIRDVLIKAQKRDGRCH